MKFYRLLEWLAGWPIPFGRRRSETEWARIERISAEREANRRAAQR